jgi:hypothetical protein
MISDINPVPSWRHFSVRSPIKSCVIELIDLKRLYDIIDVKQSEEGKRLLALLVKQPNETDEQFVQRKANVQKAFVTHVTITAPGGESVTGSQREIFDSPIVPERIDAVMIGTELGPKSISYSPPNSVTLFLDFRRAPWLNFGVTPSAPTPNESNYSISAIDEGWAASLGAQLRRFFEERKTPRDWVHAQGAYDVLLICAFVPLTIWLSYLVGYRFVSNALPSVLITSIYVYLFFFILNLFRVLFSYTRSVFPLVELRGARGNSTIAHRTFWWLLISGIAIGVIGNLLSRLV